MSAEEFESMFAEGGDVDLFGIAVWGARRRRQGRRTAAYKGDDLSAETTISLDEAYHGTARLIQLDDQKIKVTIPCGIADEQIAADRRKRMEGIQARSQRRSLPYRQGRGASRKFHRKGSDLHCDFPVDVYTAILGGKTLVKTLKGSGKSRYSGGNAKP